MSIFQVKENDLQKSKNLTSEVKDFNLRSKENELQEVKNLDSNYIENNKSKYSKREYSFGENGLGTFQNVFLAAESPQLPCIDFVMSDHFYPALMGSKTPTSKCSESKEFRWGSGCP